MCCPTNTIVANMTTTFVLPGCGTHGARLLLPLQVRGPRREQPVARTERAPRSQSDLHRRSAPLDEDLLGHGGNHVTFMLPAGSAASVKLACTRTMLHLTGSPGSARRGSSMANAGNTVRGGASMSYIQLLVLQSGIPSSLNRKRTQNAKPRRRKRSGSAAPRRQNERRKQSVKQKQSARRRRGERAKPRRNKPKPTGRRLQQRNR